MIQKIQTEKISVLFVCMGNICRSPMAEGVMRKLVEEAGLGRHILVDSAGTHDYHVNEPPDLRAQVAARRRGYELSGLRARQVQVADFDRFDLLLAMDFNNMAALRAMSPAACEAKIGLLMPYASNRCSSIVHDPYYRSAKDFNLVLDCIEDGCRGVLQVLVNELAFSEMGACLDKNINAHAGFQRCSVALSQSRR